MRADFTCPGDPAVGDLEPSHHLPKKAGVQARNVSHPVLLLTTAGPNHKRTRVLEPTGTTGWLRQLSPRESVHSFPGGFYLFMFYLI